MKNTILFILFISLPVFVLAQSVKVVTNHIGYEFDGAKKAIIVADSKQLISSFKLINVNNSKDVFLSLIHI